MKVTPTSTTAISEYVKKFESICTLKNGRQLNYSGSKSYKMPSLAMRPQNMVVYGTPTSKIIYLDMDEPDPQERSFDIGDGNKASSMHYSPELDLLFIGTLKNTIQVLSYQKDEKIFKIEQCKYCPSS